MRRALVIVSLMTLSALGVAIITQALLVAWDVTYTPTGQPVDPTPQAVGASLLAAVSGLLAFPLTLATFVLGVIATAQQARYPWLAAILAAGLLAFVGLVVMAWVLLSASSPIALQTPLVAIPLVTALYGLLAAPRRR